MTKSLCGKLINVGRKLEGLGGELKKKESYLRPLKKIKSFYGYDICPSISLSVGFVAVGVGLAISNPLSLGIGTGILTAFALGGGLDSAKKALRYHKKMKYFYNKALDIHSEEEEPNDFRHWKYAIKYDQMLQKRNMFIGETLMGVATGVLTGLTAGYSLLGGFEVVERAASNLYTGLSASMGFNVTAIVTAGITFVSTIYYRFKEERSQKIKKYVDKHKIDEKNFMQDDLPLRYSMSTKSHQKSVALLDKNKPKEENDINYAKIQHDLQHSLPLEYAT